MVSSHVLAGALIGRAVARHPVAAFGAGIVSHFVMDACPHWTAREPWSDEFVRVAKCDGCAAMAAIVIAAGLSPGRSRRAVIAAMMGAALPDMDKPVKYFLGVSPFPEAVNRFHKRIQRESPDLMPVELASAAVLAAAVGVVFRLVR